MQSKSLTVPSLCSCDWNEQFMKNVASSFWRKPLWLAISDMTLMCEGNIEVGTVVMCFAAKDGQSGVQDCW